MISPRKLNVPTPAILQASAKRADWSKPENKKHLDAAPEDMRAGKPIRQVARDSGIPRSVLRRWRKKTDDLNPQVRRTVLGEFEAELHRHILDMAGRGFGMDVRAVKDLAVKMARVMGKASFVGSNGWLRRFKKRSRLSVRIAEGFERTRAGAMNPTNLNKYFELLRAGS